MGPPNLVKVQTVVPGNQGCDLRANRVCLHGIRLERFGISQTWLCASQMHSAPVLHFCLPSNGNFQGFLTEWKHMSGSHDRACFCEYVAECFGSGSRSRSKNLLGMWAWF